MGYREDGFRVREILKKHHKWMSESLTLIASENVTSALVREVTASDFGHRYAEGPPGNRLYEGCKYIDDVENLAIELAKRLFDAEHVNVQPTSGVVANLATFSALAKAGDTMMALQVPHGGHISHAKVSAAGLVGLKIKAFPFDAEEMNIDVDKSIDKIREVGPKFLLFGGSVFLFPHPVKELRAVADEVGAKIAYDAAHVLGLIAGKQFQHPFKEGADIVTSSRHKTFPGPQGGLIMCREELAKKVDRAVFPGVVSNHHMHHMAGLAVTLAEMLEFGEEYAKQIIRNSKALGQALYERGFNVMGEKKGFTESHQLVVDVSDLGGGTKVAKDLEKANIILNKNLMPWDDIDSSKDPSGIRIGTQELTRIGMKEGEMREVAELIGRVAIDRGDIEKVKKDIIEMKKGFDRVLYSFDEAKAYDYVEF
ncbi:MAG: serine hydroxymethyltransferase [Candidatus Hydrothermarchaeales archaeon]